MITLLALQVAVVLSKSDLESFKDYRDCVVQYVSSADLVHENTQIIDAARKACGDAQMAAGIEIAADDIEKESGGKKLSSNVDVRMNFMENELTADALSALADRRTKAK